MLGQVVIEVALAAKPSDQVTRIHALHLFGLLPLGARLPHLRHLGVSVDYSPRLKIIIKKTLQGSIR